MERYKTVIEFLGLARELAQGLKEDTLLYLIEMAIEEAEYARQKQKSKK